MRLSKYFCLAVALLFPAVLYAGQITGSITSGGKAVARANVEINCSGTIGRGATAGDGEYRINVPREGQCTLTLPDYAGASAPVSSTPGPSSYNFELIKRGGNYELRRR
jgi:hypothetical protein